MKKSLHEIVKGSSGYELLEEIANLKGDVNKYEVSCCLPFIVEHL